MTKWFVVHDLIHYERNKHLIGFDKSISTKNKAKKFIHLKVEDSNFYKIAKDDIIVYYGLGNGVIVGIFKVISEKPFDFKGEYGDGLALEIEPLKEIEGSYLDFRRLLKTKSFESFDLQKCFKECYSIIEDNHYEEIFKAFYDNSYH